MCVNLCPKSEPSSKNCGSSYVKKMVKIPVIHKDLNVNDCSKRFVLKNQNKNRNKAEKLLISYITEKKDLSTLAKENHICIKTIKKT